MKIVVVDKYPLLRQGIISILSAMEGVEIIGETGICSEAVELIQQQQPDIVIIDCQDASSLEVVKACREYGSSSKVIILTSSISKEAFQKACMMGVDSFLLRDSSSEELMIAVQLVSKGRKYYDFNLIETVLCETDNNLAKLTEKEREVFLRLAEGLNNGEIAKKLYISESTVKKYVSRILAKLELSDRNKVIRYAYKQGLFTEN
jgi:DNA-binding NarL/FixJ family response regulator